ncbi:MAG: hypothetical protein JWO11_282 [Nocardioides sp.]|nr:hypothetical protein [Nocardioides sp.]
MHRSLCFRRPVLLSAILLLVGGAIGCGGDESGTPAPATSDAPTAAAFTVTDGTSPADLLACLQDADLPAVDKDSLPMGVEVPVRGIEVGPLSADGGDDQGADLWVFTDPAAAADNRAMITLSDQDTPTSRVAGNVVVRFFHAPDQTAPQLVALLACLPA